MQKKGPGRNVTNANPNFVLTEMLVYLRKGDLRQPIALNRAWAGFSQANFGAGQLIDGKLDSSNGWAIAPVSGRTIKRISNSGKRSTWKNRLGLRSR